MVQITILYKLQICCQILEPELTSKFICTGTKFCVVHKLITSTFLIMELAPPSRMNMMNITRYILLQDFTETI